MLYRIILVDPIVRLCNIIEFWYTDNSAGISTLPQSFSCMLLHKLVRYMAAALFINAFHLFAAELYRNC